MSKEPKEYSLDELLEHPVLRVQMATEGLEHRYLELILNANGLRRPAEAGRDFPPSISFCS
jgi:hypothetical protein